MNKTFVEKNNICQGFLPVAMNTAANTGDAISLKGYGRCAIVIFKAVGTAGDDPVVTLLQGTDVAFATNKALPITRVDKKQAATNLLAVGTFTKSTPSSLATNDVFTVANTWSNTDLAEQAAIIVIDVDANDLDADNGYDCIRASIADVGTNASLGTMLYFLHEPRYVDQPLASAIVD